ncbi:hypothetical protein GFS03_04680 [Sulfolobus sp. E5-1-F]|uniref:hypothetical protein n=1 Tax=Saccharolobus sp. E5-1-F TaxID=2663019 RepID=UPI001297062E|nr:hypothetical protein [Sulfolobus sp. E5-1-F]QGA53920.1 hypothetical protein GFS03_04680 [Sulfolobus sp. E5-1-F]
MARFRSEVVIFSILTIIAVVLWFFVPVFGLKSINYEQMITPLGFQILFFESKYLLISPLTILAVIFFIISAVLPLAWRSSRYSLYASTIAAGFGVVMIVNTFIFQQRYLHYYGYSVLPTPNGAFYIFFPSTTYFGLSLYLLVGALGLSVVNSATRARWLSVGRMTLIDKLRSELEKGGIIRGLLTLLTSLGLDYAVVNDTHLKVMDLSLLEEDERNRRLSIFFESNEVIVFSKNSKKVLYQNSEGEIKYYDLEEGIRIALSKILERAVLFNNKQYGGDDNNNKLYN